MAGSVLRIRRREVEERVAASGIASPSRVARAMYREIGASLVELLALADPRKGAGDRVVFTERAIARLAELDRAGGVALVAHLGNWDLVGCAAAERVRLAIVTKRLSARGLDGAWQRLRAARGIHLVFADGAMRAAVDAARGGEVVAVLIDQAPERTRGTIVHAFLGRPARLDLVPALVASRARRPAGLVLAHRRPDGRQHVDIVEMFYPEVGAERVWAERVTRACADALADHVRRHPSSWLWLHRRWKDVPADASRPAGSRLRLLTPP